MSRTLNKNETKKHKELILIFHILITRVCIVTRPHEPPPKMQKERELIRK